MAAALAINVGASIQRLRSLETAGLLLAYLFIFLFCSNLRDGRGLVAGSVVLSGTLLGGLGLYQSLSGLERLAASAGPDLPEAFRARIASGRALGTFGLPGALGGFLAISIPVSAWWTFRTPGGGARRAIGLAALAIQLGGLLATRSAAATLALAAALAVVVWPRTRGGGPRRRLAAVAVVLAGVVVAGLLLAARMSAPGSESEGAGPIALRAGNMTVAAVILARHPLFGAGLGCYGIAFPAHRTEGMNESRFAHNSYIQLLSEGGLLLGVLVLVAAAACAVTVIHRAAEDGSAPYLAMACLAFLIHNMLDFTFYLPSVGMVFFCIAGLACGFSRARGSEPITLRSVRIVSALLLAGLALASARSDLALEKARLLVLGGRSDESLAAAREATAANPIDPDAWSFTSHLLLDRSAAGDPDALADAEDMALKASRLDPFTPHHWHHLGRVRLARGDPQGAYLALSRAADLYPMKIEYRRDRDSVAAALSGGSAR